MSEYRLSDENDGTAEHSTTGKAGCPTPLIACLTLALFYLGARHSICH